MWLFANCLCFLLILHCSYAPPVIETPPEEADDPALANFVEYHRYLNEVVQALESDPDFKEQLMKASDDDIKSGKLAEKLDFVHHNVRTTLDEIKRRELDRLRHLATKQYELMNELDDNGVVSSNDHVDHANPHTFEIEDLKKLIQKTTTDLEAVDKKRKEEFKEYEMKKKFEEHQKMENMDENKKKEYMESLKKEEEDIKHHKPLHHPGSKQQLEEVWEEQDHMDQRFNPKTFFMMHDVDGNGVWDADEVKALFIKELNKLYSPNGPNKDLHERAEEMERMREHVFKEYDQNHDGLIQFSEFMAVSESEKFNTDEGWKTIEDNQIYSQNEYEEYERRRLDEVRYLQQRGLLDAHGQPVPGAQHQIHQALQQYRAYQEQQAHLQYQQQHPGQPQYYPPGQVPQYQQPPQQGYQQPPQQAYQQPGQVPQYQQQYQPPQGQFQGQQQGQLPPQPQFQGQQPPQGQFQAQQPPQGQFQGQVQSQPAQNNVNQGQVPPIAQAQPVINQQGQAQQGAAQIQQGQVQSQQGQAAAQQGQAQAQQGQAQAQQVHAQAQQGQVQMQSGQAQVQQGQAPAQQGQAPVQQGQAPAQQGLGQNPNPSANAGVNH